QFLAANLPGYAAYRAGVRYRACFRSSGRGDTRERSAYVQLHRCHVPPPGHIRRRDTNEQRARRAPHTAERQRHGNVRVPKAGTSVDPNMFVSSGPAIVLTAPVTPAMSTKRSCISSNWRSVAPPARTATFAGARNGDTKGQKAAGTGRAATSVGTVTEVETKRPSVLVL